MVWKSWDKKAKAMADFGDNEYMYMLCVKVACVKEGCFTQITQKIIIFTKIT